MSSLQKKFTSAIPWVAQPGPQYNAMLSKADVLLYGGAAGGGKTSLAVGLASIRHKITLFLRREGTQLGGVLEEVAKVTGDIERKGYAAQPYREWKLPEWDGVKRKIVFGSTPNLGDELRYQGRERDLLVIDEAANMLSAQVEFLMGWTRSDDPNQRCRVLLCSNPPTGSDGWWLKEMFAPWLDPSYPNPAVPGELRWFATIEGKRVEVDEGFTQIITGKQVKPQSYSFIPAKVTDNKYLSPTYMTVLNAMPEPRRSQMLLGDWTAGQEDNIAQVIPSEWIDIAVARWEKREYNPSRIVSVGVDPSRGGRDSTVIACREDWHFHELMVYEGEEMKTGGDVAAKVLELAGQSACPVHVDVIGIGASVVDHLTALIGNRCVPINAASKSEGTSDWSGTLKFINKRAEGWWRMRDLLNPENGYLIELPKSARLKAELTSPTYQLMANGIKIEAKADLIKRLGKSTDMADALILSSEKTAIMNIVSMKRADRSYRGV